MPAFPRIAGVLFAVMLPLAAGAADVASPAATPASTPAGDCRAPGADRTANRRCAALLARLAEAQSAAGRNDTALAALARADEFDPDDLRFAMMHAGLSLKLAGQLTPAGIDAAAKASPGNVGVALMHSELAASRKDYAAALADVDRVIAQRPGALLAWETRAGIDEAAADFATAHADVDRALGLDPKSPAALRMRAILRNYDGDHAGALSDYETAHATAPRPDDPFVLGSTQFLLRRFADAAATLAVHPLPAPDGTYWRLWRYMALARLDGIEPARGSLGPGTPPGASVVWPGPVVDFLNGSIDGAALLDLAQKSQSSKDLSQVCEAHFYMAEDALLRQRGDPVALWRQAARECPINFHEYEGAVAELKAAGVSLAPPGSTLAASAASATH